MSPARPELVRPLGRRLLAGLAVLALAGAPSVAKEPRAPKAPPVTAKAEPAPAPVDDSALAAIDAQLQANDAAGAAAAAAAIVGDPTRAALHGGAWARLGAAYQRLGYRYAALVALAEGVRLDASRSGPYYAPLLGLADDLDEEIWVGGLVGKDFSVRLDDAQRGRVAYFAARALFDQGSWGQALGILSMVPDDGRDGFDALVLEGMALAQQSRWNDALVPLLTAYEQARQKGDDPERTATLALSVARTFYAQGNWARAMEYYDKVPRSDRQWPIAHAERAWAHFRVDDMPGTVALLTTHTSPFFADWYLPEAELLRAQALYLMCKFGAVEDAVKTFKARYTPIAAALDASLGAADAAAALADADRLAKGESTKLPASVIRRFASDDRTQDALVALAAGRAELAKLGRDGADALVRDRLEARLAARTATEGARVLEAARDARAELDSMLADLELTLIDIGSLLAGLYQQAAATGQAVDLGDDAEARELRKKGKRVWPFEGEYWADELGWYRVVARPECPASMRRVE